MSPQSYPRPDPEDRVTIDRERPTCQGADFSRVERERDEAVRRAADLEQVREELKQLRLLSDGQLEDIQQLESGRDELIDSLRNQRDQANELTDKIAAELRLVTRERDSLARRCAVRFEETQALKVELASALAELERHCGETDCDGDECQDDLQETYPGSGIYE